MPPIVNQADNWNEKVIKYLEEIAVNGTGGIIPKGTINVPADFPNPTEVQDGWLYFVLSNVTDNDPTKTNTGQSFLAGEEIVWNGTNWSSLGATAIWADSGTDITPANPGRNIDIGTGLLKDNDVVAGVALGDAGNTALNTTNKTILGSINELLVLITAESIWDRTGTDVTFQNAGDTLKFADGEKVIFGTGADIEKYFDGSDYVSVSSNQYMIENYASWLQGIGIAGTITTIWADDVSNVGGEVTIRAGTGIEIATHTSGLLQLKSAGEWEANDKWLSSAIRLSQSGTTGLSGFTATSIIGALNELKVSVPTFNQVYDAEPGVNRIITVDNGHIIWNMRQDQGKYIEFKDTYSGNRFARFNPSVNSMSLEFGTGSTVSMRISNNEISVVKSYEALKLKDYFLSSAISLSQSGTTGLSGFTATSIVGALNELKAGASVPTLDQVYNSEPGVTRVITVDDGNILFNMNFSNGKSIEFKDTYSGNRFARFNPRNMAFGTMALEFGIGSTLYMSISGEEIRGVTNLKLNDSYLTNPINLSQSGTTGLSGFTATSIIGALNELKASAPTFDQVYDSQPGVDRIIDVDDGNIKFKLVTSGYKNVVFSEVGGGSQNVWVGYLAGTGFGVHVGSGIQSISLESGKVKGRQELSLESGSGSSIRIDAGGSLYFSDYWATNIKFTQLSGDATFNAWFDSASIMGCINELAVEKANSTDIVWDRTGTILTTKTANDQLGIGTTASFVDFTNAQAIISQGDSGASLAFNIGLVAESVASGSTGVGLYGVSKTAGAVGAYGIFGSSKVNASADAGNSVGVIGDATQTHAGGDNIAFWAQASGGANNYSFYGQSGNIYNAGNLQLDGTLTVNTGIGVNATLDASAILQADSTTKGFLPPRMTTTQRDAISSPAEGLMIYNTTTNTLNYYNGTAWESVSPILETQVFN